jgi:hypothetical protein
VLKHNNKKTSVWEEALGNKGGTTGKVRQESEHTLKEDSF